MRSTPSPPVSSSTRAAVVLRAVVDRVVCAGAPGVRRFLIGADGGYDRRASPLGKLDGVVANSARAAGNEDGEALNRPAGEQTAMGSHGGDADAGALLETHVFREGHGVLGWQCDVLGGCAERPLPLAFEQPHALAYAGSVDACADRLDRPRAVAVRHDSWEWHLRAARAGAGLPVGRVDA